MGKYRWDNEKLESLYKNLKEKSINGKEEYKDDLNLLKSMLGWKVKDDYIQESCSLKTKEIIRTLAKSFHENSTITKTDIPFMTLFRMDNESYLNLINDFYKTHFSLFYDTFLEEFNRRKTNLEIFFSLNNQSNSYHFLTQRETFIKITKSNKISDLGNFPHEYGHATTFLLNPNFVANMNNLFLREIDGYYFEINFLNYLISNHILEEQASYLKFLIDYKMYENSIYLEKNHFNLTIAIYFYSYLVSTELSMMDKIDSERILEKIINSNAQSIEESFEYISSYITIGENMSSYQKKIKKELENIK